VAQQSRIVVYVDPETRRRVKVAAAEQDTTVSDWLGKAIDGLLGNTAEPGSLVAVRLVGYALGPERARTIAFDRSFHANINGATLRLSLPETRPEFTYSDIEVEVIEP
jgi:hypothetical protein